VAQQVNRSKEFKSQF